MAYIITAFIVMAYIVTAYIVMAYIITAFTVIAAGEAQWVGGAHESKPLRQVVLALGPICVYGHVCRHV